jgi:hypothetical protein
MHSYGNWSDSLFNQVSDASYYIGDYIAKWGRIHVSQCKEKYGTVRVYCNIGYSTLYEFLFPKHNFIRAPKWLWKIDLFTSYHIYSVLINKLVIPYQKWIYKKAYKKALYIWPHLKEEILCCADFGELLEDLC